MSKHSELQLARLDCVPIVVQALRIYDQLRAQRAMREDIERFRVCAVIEEMVNWIFHNLQHAAGGCSDYAEFQRQESPETTRFKGLLGIVRNSA